MIRFMCNVIRLLCSFVPFLNAGVLGFILMNAAILQWSYLAKYNEAHSNLMREHERQYYVTVAQQAQRTVQLQADALRLAFLQEQERHKHTNTAYQNLQTEYRLFVTTLQRLEPEAFQRTVKALTYVPPKFGKEKK